ncbi:MAG: capsular polysaccharide biosynthesis protein [Ulvibacter sp.]|jgi:capsular polysaccharide biosynthesis protein
MCIAYLEEHLDISFNENDGYINITATMDEPVAAAQMVRNAQNLLQEFIIDYNIKKSDDELKFIEERLGVVKEDYSDKRARLGEFRDRNKNGILSTTRNREEQLKSEYDLAYNMYSELSSQRESAKLQVEKDTPIFTELQPALITSEPSAPNKVKIVIGSIVIGMLIAIALILLKFLSPVLLDYLKKNED